MNNVAKANKLIHSRVAKTKLFFPHSILSKENDFYVRDVGAQSFYFTGIKPIIYDSCLRVEAERLGDIHDGKEQKSLYDIIASKLKEHRYVNYVFNNVARSNAKDVFSDLLTIKDLFSRVAKNSICVFQYAGSRCRSLIDTISVSFYKMSDVISIFDSRRADGICMEVFMLSKSINDITYPGKTMTWRFIFSKYKDNLFVIDGERIIRPSDMSISDGFIYMDRLLFDNTANDKPKKKRASK
jgi:hypothetical protein